MGQQQRGFTLIEVLLSVAIISVLAGLSLPVYQSFNNRNELDIATQSLANALRRAQLYSRGMQNDSQWGVEIQPDAATLFKGNVFASRDTAYDEPTVIPDSITVSGDSEILFAKLSGAPDAAASITLTSINNDTRTVTINAKGTVTY